MDDTVRNLQEIAHVLNDIKASLPGLGRGVSNMSMVNKELQKKVLEVNAAELQLAAATKIGGQAMKNAQRSVNNLAKEYASLDSASKKTANLLGLSTKAAKDQATGFARSSKGFQAYTNAIRQSHNMLTSFNQNMGVQKMTFSAAYKSLIDYNKGMFTLTKTQRVFGQSGSNINEALTIFRNKTTLSTVEALNFANSFNQLYVGVQPTAQSIAGFAAMLQSSFGPNVEKTQEAMNTLLQLQQKFPPILDNIKAAHTAMAEGMMGEAQALGSQNISLLLAMGADTNQLKTVLQAQTTMTGNEKDFMTSEQKSAKAAQATEEAILGVGKTSEKVFQGVASVLETTHGWLEKNTTQATLLQAAIGGINMGQNAATGSIGTLLATGTGAGLGTSLATKGVMGTGKALAGAAGAAALPLAAAAGVVGIGASAYQFAKMRKAQGQEKGIRETVVGSTGKIENMAREKYGSAKFEKKADRAGLGKLEGIAKYNATLKIVRELRNENIKIGTVEQEQLKRLGEVAMKYKAVEATLQIQEGFQKNILDYTNAQVEVAGRFASITAGQLKEQISDSEKALQISKEQLKNTTDTVTAFFKLEGIEIKGLGKQERSAKVEGLVQKERKVQTGLEGELKGATNEEDKARIQKDINKSISSQTALKGKLALISTAEQKVLEQSGVLTDKKAMKEATLIDQSGQFLSAMERRIGAERTLYEQAHFGMGVSIKMLQKQITLEKSKIEQAKKYVDFKGVEIAKNNNISQQTMKQLENSSTEEQRVLAVNKALDESKTKGKDRTELQNALNRHVLQYNKYQGDQLIAQGKIFELTKSQREGYLGAIREMSVNAGGFAKIIATQNKGVSQLFDITKKATGKDVLSTNVLGGRTSKEEAAAAGKFKAKATYGVGGIKSERTIKEETTGDTLLYKPATTDTKNVRAGGAVAIEARAGIKASAREKGDFKGDGPATTAEKLARRGGREGQGAAAAAGEKRHPSRFLTAAVGYSKASADAAEKVKEGELNAKKQHKAIEGTVSATGIDEATKKLGIVEITINDKGGLKATLKEVKGEMLQLKQGVGLNSNGT